MADEDTHDQIVKELGEDELEKQGKSDLRLKPMVHRGVMMWASAELDKLPGFKTRDDDVWVCSFPRSGTTLTQTITHLVMTLDFEKGRTVQLDDCFPNADLYEPLYPFYRGLDFIDKMDTSSPRLIKSHMHHFLLPEDLRIRMKGRIIYICRNPKAAVPSLYRILRLLNSWPARNIQEYLEFFLKGEKVINGPWWTHVRQFWERRNDPNILFLQFEKLIGDRKAAIRQIADFLGRTLTEDDVQRIFDETTIEKMKGNNAVNFSYQDSLQDTNKSDGAFINKGEVSGWRRDVPDDLNRRIDEMLQFQLGDTDLKFE